METGVGKRLLKCENTEQATWNLQIEWSERILCLEKSDLEGLRGGEKVIIRMALF